MDGVESIIQSSQSSIRSLPTMAAILTVSAKTTPFPFAAIAAAAYTQKAEVNYEESASTVTFDYEGSSITAEDQIVQALAKAGGLAEDSAKVSVCKNGLLCSDLIVLSDTRLLRTRENPFHQYCRSRDHCCFERVGRSPRVSHLFGWS